MPSQRLLERFYNEGQKKQDTDTIHTLVTSISHYLFKLLNTRQGSVIQAPDFGLPDISHLAQSFGGDTLFELEDTLQKVITKYEPRLKDVQVHYQPDSDNPFNVTFALQGRIVYNAMVYPIIFETILAADGHIEIQGKENT